MCVYLRAKFQVASIIVTSFRQGSKSGPLKSPPRFSDLKKIGDWALQWKIKFNPSPNKQVQKVHFSNRSNKDISLSITFNNSKVIAKTFRTNP